jgi:hypothetical protein
MTRKITGRISSRKRLQMQALERHSRRCIICHHPEREAVEGEFRSLAARPGSSATALSRRNVNRRFRD